MAVEPDDAKFTNTLDEASKEKAKLELNERNDKDTISAVQTFRQWILEQDWLKTPTDLRFLLKFLRVSKFSQLGARERLENYWTVRTLVPEWFKDVDPAEKMVQEILRLGIYVCPKRYDNEGRRVLINRIGRLDISEAKKKWGLENVYRAMVMVADWMCFDENVQVNGIQSFVDSTDLTWNAAVTLFTGENGKKYIKYSQRAQPARLKRINIYKELSFFDAIHALVAPFLTEKTRDRFQLHGDNMVSVYKCVDKGLLPNEYLPDEYAGPSAGTIEQAVENMIEDMMSSEFRSFIKDLSSDKYGVDLSKRKKDEDLPSESFRKLHVD